MARGEDPHANDAKHEEEERAIREKLRISGWEKSKRRKHHSSADDDRFHDRNSQGSVKRSPENRKKKNSHEKDSDRNRSSRERRSKPRDSHRKRGSRRSRSRKSERDRGRVRHKDKDRHTKSRRESSKLKSRRRSSSKRSLNSRTRRLSLSPVKHRKKKDSSKSASPSPVRSSKKKSSNEEMQVKEDRREKSSSKHNVSPFSDVDENKSKKLQSEERENANAESEKKSRTKNSPPTVRSRSKARSDPKTRSPSGSRPRKSRRSRRDSRSVSTRGRRRRLNSRSVSKRHSRSHSRKRSRRARGWRHRRSYSRSHSKSRTKRQRSKSEQTKKKRDANSSPEPHEHPPVSGDGTPSITQLMQQYPTLSLQDIISKMQASNVTMAAAVAMKPARELYVGNLPATITGPQLQEFLGTIIQQVGLSTQPGNSILSVWISTDGHFAFCEMRSVEECNLALLLNQLPLLGQPLKFGRPRSFMGPPQPMPIVSARTQTALVNLGCTPNPAWFASPDISALGSNSLDPMAAAAAAMPLGCGVATLLTSSSSSLSEALSESLAALPSDLDSRQLLMSNVPAVLEEEQVKELVQPFGTLKFLKLIKEPITGSSTGNALFEYRDQQVTKDALSGLNELDIGGVKLSVRLAPNSSKHPQLAVDIPDPSVSEPCPVLRMANMVTEEELKNDDDFEDLKEDVEEECKRFGTVLALEIPRPKETGKVQGIGSIFVKFSDTKEAAAALKALSGRKFGGNVVRVTYFAAEKFEAKDFE